MKATGLELMLAGCYDEQSDYVHFGTFLPVTPNNVKMPLLPEWRTEIPGLLSLAQDIIAFGKTITGNQDFIESFLGLLPMQAFQFRLLPFRLDAILEALTFIANTQADPYASPFERDKMRQDFSNLRQHFVEKLSALQACVGGWVWLQWCNQAIFVWDAERPPPKGRYTIDQVGHPLLAAGWLTIRRRCEPDSWH